MIYLEDEIIIVERVSDHAGYIVSPNNLSMLDTARSWAKSVIVEKDENGNFKYISMNGVEHRYKNGQFKIKLYDSARRSSQGGKLSFWNCTVTAPDGKDFIVGINADLLLNLMMNSTIVNGQIQGDVWLGRANGNVGVYTESMEDFKQAKEDKDRKNALKKGNNKYSQYDIVETLTMKQIYMGELYKYFDITDSSRYATVEIYRKPIKVHFFITVDDALTENEEINYSEIYPYGFEIKKSKPARIVVGKTNQASIKEAFDEYINIYSKGEYAEAIKLQYSLKEQSSDVEAIKQTVSKYFRDSLCPFSYHDTNIYFKLI